METIYRVDGMTCNHCVAHVKQEVGQVPGAIVTALTLDDGLLHVESPAPIDFALIEAAVAEAGDYTVSAS